MNNKKITIITVCFNSAKTIKRTIDSVKAQTYSNIEYIIIDGQSTDGTIDIINEYIDYIDCFVSEPDSGIYDAMNKGVKKATGDWIAFLNADDYYADDAIIRIADVCNEIENDVDIISAQINYLKDNEIIGKSKYSSFKSIWNEMPVAHPATFVRHSVFDKIGLFDTSFKIAADYEFMVSCFIHDLHCRYESFVTTYFSIDGTSGTNHEELYKEDKRILEHYACYCEDKSVIKKSLLKKEKILTYLNVKKETMKKIIDTNKQIYIWGTGYWGNSFASTLKNCDINFEGFIDNDKTKQGDFIQGHLVLNPIFLKKNTDRYTVIIAVEGAYETIQSQIIKMCKNMCIIYYEDIIDRIFDLEGT